MNQSKRVSLLEALTNTFIGAIITMIFSPLFYWLCDIQMSVGKMGILTLLFTILSIVRGYVIRRFFNGAIHRYFSNDKYSTGRRVQ